MPRKETSESAPRPGRGDHRAQRQCGGDLPPRAVALRAHAEMESAQRPDRARAMDRRARPCGPLRHFAERQPRRLFRRVLSQDARHLDGDLRGRRTSRRSRSGRRATPGAAAGCSSSDDHFLLEHDTRDPATASTSSSCCRTSRRRGAFACRPSPAILRSRPATSSRRAWCCRAGASCSAA